MNNEKKYTNENFFQIIGKISIVFATLDFFTTQLIFRLISAEYYDDLGITDSTTLGQKLKKLEKLKEENIDYPAALVELRKILPKAISFAEERNRYIHDQWVFTESEISYGKIFRVRIRRKNNLNINFSDVEENKTLIIEDLNDFCDEIINMQVEIKKIVESIPPINRDNIKIKKESSKN